MFALKRVALRSTQTFSLKFEAPQEPGEYTYQVFLMSDGYLGLDQQFDFQVTVTEAEPCVEGSEDSGLAVQSASDAGRGNVGEYVDTEYFDSFPSLA